MKPKFSRQIFEKFPDLKFIKICPLGAELFQAGGRTDGQTDRQTDMTKLLVAIRNFENAPRNNTFFLNKRLNFPFREMKVK
jgi:hypothetical protein